VMMTSNALDLIAFPALMDAPTLCLALVHDPPSGSIVRRAVASVTRARRGGRTAWIGCITERMRDLYVAAGAEPCGVVVVPNPAILPADVGAPGGPSAATGRLSYPGNGRLEKGFSFIVSALPRLLEDFEVVVQDYLRGDEGPDVTAAAEHLRSMGSAHLTVITGELSKREYEDVVAGSMAVMLPYRPDDYGRGRISAVLPEAWAAGVPVIVSDGWWGADMVRARGGGVVFEFGDVDDLLRAAAEVRQEWPRLASEARVAHEALAASDGPDAFAAALLGLGGGQSGP
jgi:glycosyltransferase involved in cell wall biosynthesis